MRAIVIKESLASSVPDELSTTIVREYRHHLDEQTPITIVESEVRPEDAASVAMNLSRLMKPTLFYAHLVDEERMLVVFPRTVVDIRRGQADDEHQAQQIGQLFSIPEHQMQFLAMFDDDHPDATGRA